MRLHMNIQTHNPTFLPVLSTSLIDYYDGGTVRLNTEFYSWDTSFGLVNPRLRYSCLRVVLCVNLNTFLSASCRWDGDSRPPAQLSLNVHSTFPECSLNIHPPLPGNVQSLEHWAAMVNETLFGLGIYHPDVEHFDAGAR
jgi:hypothetical protein